MQVQVQIPAPSGTPTTLPPDVDKAGEVLATLNDWRAMLFFMGVIIVFLLCFIAWREWAMQGERKEMRVLAASFAESAGRVANALGELSTKIAVLSALTARAEALIADESALRESHDE